MSKTKMRCITCGKWFQSANAKEVTCPECVQKARKEKLASKAVPQTSQKPFGASTTGPGNLARSVTPPPKSKQASSGTSHWFDNVNDVKVSEPEPPQRARSLPTPTPNDTHGGPGNRSATPYREERGGPGAYKGPPQHREERAPGPGSGGYRGPGAYRNAPLSGSIVGGIGQRPRLPMGGGTPGRGPRPGEQRAERYPGGEKRGKPAAQKNPRTPAAPKPKREKIPPPEPFKPTPEQIYQVEERYKELAIPSEFDGIRTQLAHECGIPKKAVKQIVKALRDREHLPSWWETQTYVGNEEEKEKIKAAYEPYLPIPPVGVHRKLADELDLKPGTVYQAIKVIRQDMDLPQYNDPEHHASEFEEIKRKNQELKKAREEAMATLAAGTDTSLPTSEENVASTSPTLPDEQEGTSAETQVPEEPAPVFSEGHAMQPGE